MRTAPVAEKARQWSLEGLTVSGLDVPLRIWAETLSDEAVATQAHLWPEAESWPKELHLTNQRALNMLDQWMSEPDELGSAWWEAFETELKQRRLVFPEE